MIVCPVCKTQNRDSARFCRGCGARFAQAPAPGIVLGGEYRVVEVIKPGGMGTVYKAESGGRFYAVKEMRDTFTNPKDRQDAINRFMAEALILARLSHPHIPKIHRHFIESDRYYLVMDFVEGEDLQIVLDRQGGKRLPEEQVLTWALQLCAVLEYLHGQTPPVIFRDLKPANIMLRPDGDVSLIDFGIAKLFNPAQQGTLIGTPGYAAPEQYQGIAEPRSDIFALGATLHHLLTSRDPRQHPPFIFPPVTAVNPAITPGMEAIIQKALAMSLVERWASIGEVRQALISLAGPIKLEPGVVLAGRYQITTGVGSPRRAWGMTRFQARDLQTGATWSGIPMGADPVEDQFMQLLAALHHQTLPSMEIVTHRGITCFISHTVEGTPLKSATIQTPSQLVSIGLQLCDLLETTGSRGAGFSWVHLQASHVLLGPQGQIIINGFEYCYDWLHNRRWATHEPAATRIAHPLSWLGFAKLPRGKLLLEDAEAEDAEAAEVEIVGNAMAFTLMDVDAYKLAIHPLALRRLIPEIPRYLEQAILGAVTVRIQSLAQLRQHLLGQAEGPARAIVSAQRIDLGSVSWGESPSDYLLQLSSQSPGLLYGEIRCTSAVPAGAAGMCAVCGSDNVSGKAFCDNCGAPLKSPPQAVLKTRPRAFVEVHSTQIEIEISWDTSKLEQCGTLDGEVLITTGVDSFRIAVQAHVQPNAKFHLAQAKRHKERKEWALTLQHCDELIALLPAEPVVYELRGLVYHEVAQYENAVSDYTEAIQLNPNDAGIWACRGNAFLRMKQYDLAIQEYSKAMKLDPEQPVYYWNRGLAYESQGRKQDAINDLQQYLSLGGRDLEHAQEKIAELQQALGKKR